MRGAFAKRGIDINKDVQFINIPNPSDHLQALRRGEIELICTVEPFATQILQSNAAKLFGLPYDQAAGKLTNIILTRSDVVAAKPKELEETVRAVVKVDEFIAGDKAALIDVISKITGLDKAIAAGAVENLDPDPKMYRASAGSLFCPGSGPCGLGSLLAVGRSSGRFATCAIDSRVGMGRLGICNRWQHPNLQRALDL